jgi:hypothetical protein
MLKVQAHEWCGPWERRSNADEDVKTCRKYSKVRYRRPLYPYSHSIVPGGFDVISYTTRFTPLTSLMIRVAVAPRKDISKG